MGSSPEPAGGAMSAAVEARHLVEAIAGPQRLGAGVKAALARVARTTGLAERRVRALWNSEARAIRADEMDLLRAAAQRAEARTNEDHRHRLAGELEAAAARLAVVDEAFFRADVERLRNEAARLRGVVAGREG